MKNVFFVSAFAFLVGCSDTEQAAFMAEHAGDPALEKRMNNKVVSMTLESANLLPNCELALAGQLVWLINEQEFRTCNYKTLVWDVVSIVGAKGDTGATGAAGTNGTNGLNGANCSITQVSGGANVTCGNNTVFIANGTNGTNGSDGAGCTTMRTTRDNPLYGSDFQIPGVKITCGATQTFIDDQVPTRVDYITWNSGCASGKGTMFFSYADLDYNGYYAGIDEFLGGTVVCDGEKGATGATGAAGQSCTVASVSGGVDVTCGGTTAFVANGTNATSVPVPYMYHNGVKVGRILDTGVSNTTTNSQVYQVKVEGTSYIVSYALCAVSVNGSTGQQGILTVGSYLAAPTYAQWAAQSATEYYQKPAEHESFVNLIHVDAGSPVQSVWYSFNKNKLVAPASFYWTNSPTTSFDGYTWVWNKEVITDTNLTRLLTRSPAEIRYE